MLLLLLLLLLGWWWCVREMVDIECFLRETAQREAEAKSRLQVNIKYWPQDNLVHNPSKYRR